MLSHYLVILTLVRINESLKMEYSMPDLDPYSEFNVRKICTFGDIMILRVS
jgi:hypothetical protein